MTAMPACDGLASERREGRALSRAGMLGYGVGDFGLSLMFIGLNLYLMFYYTEVLGLAPATAGLIFMVPVVWDAASDPVMGWIAGRTRTRWGRYRPYLLFGAPVLGLSFVGLFAAPLLFPSAVVASCLLAHLIFRTAYTIVFIPYAALSASLTHSSVERAELAGFKMAASIAGGLCAAALLTSLSLALGDDRPELGFLATAALFAAVAVATLWAVFLLTREEGAPAPPTPRGTWRYLTANRPLHLLLAVVLVAFLAHSIKVKAFVYYIAYILGDPAAVGPTLTALLAIAGVSVPAWAMLARRISKRATLSIALCGVAAVQGALWATAPTELGGFVPLVLLGAAFTAGLHVSVWAMLPDTVEFGEWRSGVRDEGTTFGLMQLALKAGSGLGVGLLGLGLGAIGFVPGGEPSPGVVAGLRDLAFLVPLVGIMLALVLLRRYPIDHRTHARLVAGLHAQDGPSRAAA